MRQDRFFVLSILFTVGLSAGAVRFAVARDEPSPGAVHPLASKEEMIRDRYQRLQDRVFRLRETLTESEPENAARLARLIERSGELGLADRLEKLVEMLRDPSVLTPAVDEQGLWLADVDKLLAILLERDSDNADRRAEMERLKEYQEEIGRILEQQKALRDASAQAAIAERMRQQLDQAIQRAGGLLNRQQGISQQTAAAAQSGDQPPALSEDQQKLSEEAKQLAEDLKRLGELPSETPSESPGMQEAKNQTQSAAQSMGKSAESMSKAGESLKKGDQPGAAQEAQPPQEEAREKLRETIDRLEEAKKALEDQRDSKKQGQEQEKLAQETGALSQKMRQDAGQGQQGGQPGQQGQPGEPGQKGQRGQQGQQGEQQTPGEQGLQQAQGEMEDASESLEQDEPQEATPHQDNAIDQLQQAQKELEEALKQLREEEREEVLRDLEARFRDMLARQRTINDATVQLDAHGKDHFRRAEELQLADLSAKESKLADDASNCLHILEEDGTTIAFPRVVEQIASDMSDVAQRLAGLDVGSITQAIEQEIVDALEQMLEAVEQMRQQNEQGKQQQQGGSADAQDAPLLPASAELKLLRASQTRINTRTGAIESARTEKQEAEESLKMALQTVAQRQLECAETAKEMRDRGKRP